MVEKKDPAIKLFGKTIQLGSNFNGDSVVALKFEPSTAAVSAARTDADSGCTSSGQSILCSKQSENRGDEKASMEDPMDGNKEEEELSSSSALEESKVPASHSTVTENPKTYSNDKDSSSQNLSNKNEDQSDQTSSTHSQDQSPLKKPDKILPCPRCSSMDTKFCYFNNYNVNQPRHFCKNCQRYWTAGGTMRNVPVGAGRRKNKSSSSSHHRHLMIPELPNGLIHHGLSANGTVLAFGSDIPIPESTASPLKPIDHKSPNCVPNGFIGSQMNIPVYFGGLNNGNQNSNTMSNDPYTWNTIPWQSGFPVSFVSAQPYLACNSQGTWNMPCLPTQSICTDQSSTTTSPNSTSLGKHSRDEAVLRPRNSNEEKPTSEEKRLGNSRVVIPKTLRIDDPIEAAKSSIWDTLGIKHDKVGSSNVALGGFFRGYQQNKGVDQENEGSSMVLQANPVASSRSLTFQEIAQ